MKRTMMRAGALAGVATLATVTGAPGYAATTAKATASAFTISVAGEGSQGSGQFAATNDGSGEQTSGTSDAQGSIPTDGALQFGVAAQEAVARDNLTSAACAGIAGDGGSIVQLGESFCLQPGESDIDLSLGALGVPELDLEGEELEPVRQIVRDVLAGVGGETPLPETGESGGSDGPGLEDQLRNKQEGVAEAPVEQDQRPDEGEESTEPAPQQQPELSSGDEGAIVPSSSSSSASYQTASYQTAGVAAAPELSPEMVTDAVRDALDQVNGGLGDFGIKGSFGALQATCQAGPGLSGSANLANAGLFAQAGDEKIGLLSLPANPPPNTKVATDLSDVVDVIIKDLQANLNGELAPLGDALGDAQEQVVNKVLGQVAPQLAPLEENILEGTLNKQSQSNGTINVTALDLQVLPAAQEQLGASLASLQLGDVSCRSGEAAKKDAPVGGVTQSNPQVPTVVTAGERGAADQGLPAGLVGGLLAMLGATALVGYRRVAGR